MRLVVCTTPMAQIRRITLPCRTRDHPQVITKTNLPMDTLRRPPGHFLRFLPILVLYPLFRRNRATYHPSLPTHRMQANTHPPVSNHTINHRELGIVRRVTILTANRRVGTLLSHLTNLQQRIKIIGLTPPLRHQ